MAKAGFRTLSFARLHSIPKTPALISFARRQHEWRAADFLRKGTLIRRCRQSHVFAFSSCRSFCGPVRLLAMVCPGPRPCMAHRGRSWLHIGSFSRFDNATYPLGTQYDATGDSFGNDAYAGCHGSGTNVAPTIDSFDTQPSSINRGRPPTCAGRHPMQKASLSIMESAPLLPTVRGWLRRPRRPRTLSPPRVPAAPSSVPPR